MSLFPPIARQVFASQFDISCAQLDWTYERMRCLFCKDRRSMKKIEEDFYAIKKKKEELVQKGWVYFSGVPVKVNFQEVDDEVDE